MKQSDLTPTQLQYLVAQANALLNEGKDYTEIACGLPCDNMLINFDDGVWLVSMPTHEVSIGAAKRLLLIMPGSDPVGAAIADDLAERALPFGDGQRSKLQQVAQFTATSIASEVVRQLGGAVLVSITVELGPDDEALFYRIEPFNEFGYTRESARLQCSATSIERLAQIAALMIKR